MQCKLPGNKQRKPSDEERLVGVTGSDLRTQMVDGIYGAGDGNRTPRPTPLTYLDSQRGFLFFGTTWDQKRGQLFNCISVRSLDEISVDTERHSRI